MDHWFAPSSVAVVGASTRPGNAGASYVRALLAAKYDGALAVVHPSGEAVAGVESFASATEMLTPPELGIVAVPAARVGPAVVDLAAAGCRAVHVFSGGYAELGGDGVVRQRELVAAAAANGVALLGPNCMGIHRPASRLTFRSDLPVLEGDVAVVAQSGGVAMALVHKLAARGIGTSAVVSFGNGAALGAGWWAHAVASLPDTRAVVVHVESQGDDELESFLADEQRGRPVYVLRPTGDGWHRAAARHTGAPGGRGALAIDGIATFHDVDGLCDAIEVDARRPATARDRRLAYVTVSGGIGVLAAADCAAAGTPLASIPADVRAAVEALDGSPLVAGGNPIDLGPRFLSRRLLAGTIDTLVREDAVDGVVVHVPWDSVSDVDAVQPGYADRFLATIEALAARTWLIAHLPFLGLPGEDAARARLREAGVAVVAAPAAAVTGPHPNPHT